MNITFKPLCEADFKLLLQWLDEPHVKDWWDKDIHWTPELIYKKYSTYTKGYKVENGITRLINAYIIYADEIPIGYVQLYNAYDFLRSAPLLGLPSSLAAFDVFLGEKLFLNQGIGSRAITQFLNEYATLYTHVFADPEITNVAAIRSYEKAGFKKAITQPDTNEVWLLRENFIKIERHLT